MCLMKLKLFNKTQNAKRLPVKYNVNVDTSQKSLIIYA